MAINFGFIPTPSFELEPVLTFSKEQQVASFPKQYSYLNYMTPVRNQGQRPTCVPHAISAFLDYRLSVGGKLGPKASLKFVSVNMSMEQIYNARTTTSVDGMTYKDALEFCKNEGVTYEGEGLNGQKQRNYKLKGYGKLTSMLAIKTSLLFNGPCMIATLVRSSGTDFWRGYENYGGHATALVGYSDEKQAFLLRNSWGQSYGMKGYAWFPYEDFKYILEAWAIIN